MKKFDQELAAAQKRLVDMGELSEAMVRIATVALADRVQDASPEVTALEERLDKMQLAIDHESVRLLTVYSPVAADLRSVLALSHVNTQLERIGDQAVNLCEFHRLMVSRGHGILLAKLSEMARRVSEMVHDALDAYFERDPQKAKSTIGHDDLVDSMNDQITRELLSDEKMRAVLAGSSDMAEAMAQLLIARALERIADHATNICEEVFYMVKGDDIRHSH